MAEASKAHTAGTGSISTVSWNCRGSGGTTCSTLNWYLHCTGAELAFISETKCGYRRAKQRIDLLHLCNAIMVHRWVILGGLWLLWGSEVNVSLIKKSTSMIVAVVHPKCSREPWLIVGVYGDSARIGTGIFGGKLEN